MDFVNLPLLAASALVFASVLAGLFSARIGLSFLPIFLLAGILAGEDGMGGVRFDDHRLSFWVGNLALAVILLDGGLRTAFSTFRTGLRPAALLARSGVTLNERVAATLEIESGLNDPMAVYLTLAMIALLVPSAVPAAAGSTLLLSFVQQFGWGALVGVLSGLAMAVLLRRISSRDAGGGILALLISAAGLSVFAATGLLGGSGFLAVYLFGLLLANRAADAVAASLAAMDGHAWLAQAGMFLLLGLLVTPSRLVASLGPALAIALVLMGVARPAAVWLCLWPMRFSARETWFIAWVGLRGAVPIVLALFPLLAGTPNAALLFNVAFVVVLASLVVQGSSIGPVARWLGVAMPEPGNEQQQRALFRDFALDPHSPIGAVCDFYGLPPPELAAQPLADWLADALRRPPVAGDQVRWGPATFVVRELAGGRITAVGLGLPQ